MKIIRNEKLINRNSKIGQYASMIGLLIVVGTMVFSIQFMFNPEMATNLNQTVLIAVLFGSLIISQVSIYFGNRFGRRPRPDEQIDAALKGIPGEYSIYHYTTPVSHLLLGPAGAWILLPYHQKGKVVYQKNRWKGSGGGFLQAYMRVFGQESIGRPDLEAASEGNALEKYLKKKLDEGASLPPIRTALVFLDQDVEIDADDAPLPTMQARKLKEFIRKFAKENPFPSADLEMVRTVIEKE